MKHARLAAALFCTLTGLAATGRAETIQRRFQFTATNFVDFSGGGGTLTPPYATVGGSILLTYDPAVTVQNENETRGVSVEFFDPAGLCDSPVAFAYFPNYENGYLNFGGTASVGGVTGINGHTADFILSIQNVRGTPTLREMIYSTVSSPHVFQTRTGSVVATVVPEPASLAVLAAGTVVLARRRRQG